MYEKIKKIVDFCTYKMQLQFDKINIILIACGYLRKQILEGKYMPMFSEYEKCDEGTVQMILEKLVEIIEELEPEQERMLIFLEKISRPKRKDDNNYN